MPKKARGPPSPPHTPIPPILRWRFTPKKATAAAAGSPRPRPTPRPAPLEEDAGAGVGQGPVQGTGVGALVCPAAAAGVGAGVGAGVAQAVLKSYVPLTSFGERAERKHTPDHGHLVATAAVAARLDTHVEVHGEGDAARVAADRDLADDPDCEGGGQVSAGVGGSVSAIGALQHIGVHVLVPRPVMP